jgi:inner membrane protein
LFSRKSIKYITQVIWEKIIMDILSQTVLGATVGEVVLGKKAGNKAILWGAVGGIIPDLDVFVASLFSDVDGLFVHRGFSHALVFAFILGPILGLLIHKIHKRNQNITKFDWMKLIFLAIFTHPILDYMTTYGTGAFLPFSGYRIEFNNIAIVDVFYTVPLLLVLIVIMFIDRLSKLRRKLIIGIVLFSPFIYLVR